MPSDREMLGSLKNLSTPGKPRRIELDFVRGVAILMVMLFHFTDVENPPTGWAGFFFTTAHLGVHGVDLFLVLSGFLVGSLLLKEWIDTGRVDARRFLLRRMFKLWPPLYALLLFHAVLRRHPLHDFFWQNIFHIQNFVGTSLPQTRTLAIEEQFYLLLTIGVALLARHGARKSPTALPIAAPQSSYAVILFCVGGCVLSMLLRCSAFYDNPDDINPYWTQYRLDAPFIGVALAALFHLHPHIYRKLAIHRWPLFLSSGGGVAFLFWKPWQSEAMITVGFTLVAMAWGAFVVLMLEHSGPARHWWPYKAVARLGVYAYGIFLWHSAVRQPVLAVIERLAAAWQASVGTSRSLPEASLWMIVIPCQLAAACALGMVATRLLEWPFLRWRESRPYLADGGKLFGDEEISDRVEIEPPDLADLQPAIVSAGGD